MKSTGEVMGVGKTFGEAFVKSQLGRERKLPRPTDLVRKVFLTVKNSDKDRAVLIAKALIEYGFELGGYQGYSCRHQRSGTSRVLR